MDLLRARTFLIAGVLGTLLLPAACDDDDGDTSDSGNDTGGDDGADDGADMTGADDGGDDDGGDDGGMAGNGMTDCGMFGDEAVVCQAGQYCQDQVLSTCVNGCLSNDNCTSEQTCEKESGEEVGTCQNVGAGGPSLEDFCSKLLTCDPSGTMEICETFYNGTNEDCHNCVVDGNCGDINGDIDGGSCDAACGI